MLIGNLRKMRTQLNSPVRYQLVLNESLLELNPLLGQSLVLAYQALIHCVHCGRKTNKSFSQGYCYPCMKKLAQCDLCILRPETCHYHLGTCREPKWAEQHCMTPHYVYLANSSGLKVGITRHTQIPTRWIDQGATQALAIMKVASRRISGLVEVLCKKHLNDKTNWRKMLQKKAQPIDLVAQREAIVQTISTDLELINEQFGINAVEHLKEKVVEIEYPVIEYPSKISSHNFDKNRQVTGTLLGIKGQYLIFDTGVINIRKFTGYQVSVES